MDAEMLLWDREPDLLHLFPIDLHRIGESLHPLEEVLVPLAYDVVREEEYGDQNAHDCREYEEVHVCVSDRICV